MDYTNVTFTEDKLTEQRTLTNDILPVAARNYKDTVFRMLFREKSALLSLYNAVNKTNFTNVDDLEITTLENAVYMGMNEDLIETCHLLKEFSPIF